MLRRRPETEQILHREHGDGADLDGEEKAAPALAQRCDALEDGDPDIEHDEADEEAVDDLVGRIVGRAAFENLIDALAKGLPRQRVGHARSRL
jgi:hypothetical protein